MGNYIFYGEAMKIVICDDDLRDCETIRQYVISNLDDDFEGAVSAFHSAKDAVSFCLKNVPDILFIDVELGDMNGIELAKRLKAEFPSLIIVFISNHPGYVFSSFESEPLSFLPKPVNKAQFDKTFQRALKKYAEIHKFLPVRWQNELVNLEISDICFVEGRKRHLIFHLINKESYEVVGKIDDAYKSLKAYGFVKTHQSFIANMLHIKNFGGNEINMKNGETVLISSRRRLKAKEAYADYINRRF